MKQLLSIVLAGSLLCSMCAIAAPPESVPPAQQQKNQLPDTHQSGDYLEPQPDNNGANSNADVQGKPGSANKPSRPGSMEKGKRFHEKPQDGGTGVKQ